MDFKDLESKIADPKYAIPAAIVALVILATVGFFYFQSQQPQINPNDPQALQAENNKTIEEVGKLMDLPPGETPSVLTVTDVTQLQAQPFFARAQNGDRVLVYSGAQKAILYDPKNKKIREVSPINLAPSATESATPSGSPQ